MGVIQVLCAGHWWSPHAPRLLKQHPQERITAQVTAETGGMEI